MSDVAAAANNAENFRAELAKKLVIVSTVGVVSLAIVVLLAAAWGNTGGTAVKDAAQLIFTSILPLLGTWVGTVLAFYFTKESLEAATRTTTQLVKSVMPKLASTPLAGNIILPKDAIKAEIPAGKTIDDLAIADIKKKFEEKIGSGQKISRLPFVSSDAVCVAVIHRSIWLEMLNDGATAKVPDAANVGELLKLTYDTGSTKTFKGFVMNTLSYVPMNSTVADAKIAMESTPRCQDVIVTDSGRASEPMRGWITNVDISRLSEA